MKYFKWKLFLVLTITFLSAQTRKSTHQIQAEYYKTITTPPVHKVTVLTGLDVLLEKKIDLITGKAIALITNQTGIDRYGIPNYKRMLALDEIHLKVIFPLRVLNRCFTRHFIGSIFTYLLLPYQPSYHQRQSAYWM